MKKTIVAMTMLALAVGAYAQQFEQGTMNHLGIYGGLGTEGFSLGASTCVSPYLEVSAGVNLMPSAKAHGNVTIDLNSQLITTAQQLGYKGGSSSTMRLEGDLKRTTFEVKANVYPFGGSSTFFVSGGLSLGGGRLADLKGHSDDVAELYKLLPAGNTITIRLDEYQMDIDRNGDVKGELRVNKVRPYLGLGFGRLVPKHRVAVRVEAGVQAMGHIQVWQGNQELTATLSQHADDNLSKVIDKLTVYPVLRLSITGRLF